MSTRIGGVLLLLAGIALPIIIIDYVMVMSSFDGGADATNLQRAEFAKGVYAHLARGWAFEILAICFVATASFIFLDRPSRAGWSMAAVGALVTIPMYAVMLGGYGEIFAQPELDPDLYVVLRGITVIVFEVGQGLMMDGLGLVLFLEMANPARLLPKWLLLIGGLFNGFSGLVFLAMHLGASVSLAIGAPFALIGLAITGLLGARLAARPS